MNKTDINVINGKLGQVALKKKRLLKKLAILKTKKTKITRNLISGNIEEVEKKIEEVFEMYNNTLYIEKELLLTREILKKASSYDIVNEMKNLEIEIEKEERMREFLTEPEFIFKNFLNFFW